MTQLLLKVWHNAELMSTCHKTEIKVTLENQIRQKENLSLRLTCNIKLMRMYSIKFMKNNK